jgi:hypothetical protein
MALQLQTAITTARTILNDEDATRYSDADLLRYANDALDQMMVLAPRLFYADGDLECIPAQCLQTVSCADAHALVEIRRVKNGRAVIRTEKQLLDAFDPLWQEEVAAAAINWMPSVDDPLRFYIYPQAPANQVLEVCYVRIPPEFAADDDTLVPTVYADAVADYIVYRAETRDDEHINSNRAAQFLASFTGKVKGA